MCKWLAQIDAEVRLVTTYGSAARGCLDQRDASAFLASSGFELALRLPELVSIFAGETKRVLRCAMKGLLPEPIRTRRDKLGFVTAEEQWMKELLRDQCVHRAKESFGYANGVLRPEVVNEVEAVLNGRRRFSQMPWRVICFGAWLKRFNVVLN